MKAVQVWGPAKARKHRAGMGTCLQPHSLWDALGEDKRIRERKSRQKECVEAGEVPRKAQGPGSSNEGFIITLRKTHTVGTVHTQEKRMGVWLPELGNHLPGDRGMRRTSH